MCFKHPDLDKTTNPLKDRKVASEDKPTLFEGIARFFGFSAPSSPLSGFIETCKSRGFLSIQDYLDKNKMDVNGVYEGKTLLTHVCEAGDYDVVEFLLTKGAAVGKLNDDGSTALMAASSKDDVTIVRLLLDNGAEVNQRDKKGNTSLMRAAYNKRVGAVLTLLDNGAKIDLGNKASITPLMAACSENDAMMVKILLDNGAKIDLCDKNGDIALKYTTSDDVKKLF
ncbi:MAG: ankyrin repeat domain-containing protein [Simkaniaceae bacterium]|nr:ankyrin repeat domain-containing protein [Simkaniaceae bacterium]MCF7852907.1 ankyrin repeat domain-containing protein [Simkaniaceae bacterium]